MSEGKRTHTEFMNRNRTLAVQMLEHGVETGVLKEKDGKIMVIHGLKQKWVDRNTMALQIAQNPKMMLWLKRLVKFGEKAQENAEHDKETGNVTMMSIKDIPHPEGETNEQ